MPFLKRGKKVYQILQRELAYLLVTYAVERRAQEVYTIYNDILKHFHRSFACSLSSQEEKDHLKEMIEGSLAYGLRQLGTAKRLVSMKESCVRSGWQFCKTNYAGDVMK